MARSENPPFPRGGTYFGGNVPMLADGVTADLVSHAEIEGKTWVFEDYKQIAGQGNVKGFRTGRYVVCMAVRNVSAAAALPKLLCKMKTDGSAFEFAGRVMSQNPSLGDLAFPADEFLPAAGCVNNDIFWVVIGGPALCITDSAGTTNITTGSYVVAGGGTAGHVVKQDSNPVAGTATFVQINGAVGTAILGVNATSTDILIDVIPRVAHA